LYRQRKGEKEERHIFISAERREREESFEFFFFGHAEKTAEKT
jgi:hypothetical protein